MNEQLFASIFDVLNILFCFFLCNSPHLPQLSRLSKDCFFVFNELNVTSSSLKYGKDQTTFHETRSIFLYSPRKITLTDVQDPCGTRLVNVNGCRKCL